MTLSQVDITTAASLLLGARNGGPAPERLMPPPNDELSAYAIQEAVMAGLNDPGGVWKMALLGGDKREAAVLPNSFLFASGVSLNFPDHALIEVETAIVLARDPGTNASYSDVISSIASVHLAFEVIASRFLLQSSTTPLEQMADSFSSAAVIVGSEIEGWRDKMPDTLDISVKQDEVETKISEVAAPFIEALDFISWLSGHAQRYGRPLGKDSVIITGARVGPIPIAAKESVEATTAGTAASVTIRIDRS